MPPSRLKISVVVIARNEEKRIRECLESLLAQDYPQDLHEIIVIDNASTDATGRIVVELAARHPRLRLEVNRVRGIAPSRNRGLREARHDFVAFTDADCIAGPKWLSSLESAMREETAADPAVAAVGGPNIAPEETTLFRQAVAVAITTYWGNHGSVQGQGPGIRTAVDHLPTLNVLYDKKRVLDTGGFDENQGNISEDVELSYRLRWQGYKLIYEPEAVIRHRWREDLWGWAKNMEVYGKGRSWLMKKDRRFIKPHYLAPAGLLLITLASLPLYCTPLYLLPVLYLILSALVSFYAGLRRGKPLLIPLVFVIYVLTHYAYGVGQFHGLFASRGSDIR